jgi:serine/threonine protein kinase
MERLEGETLRDRLDRRGRLAGGETLAIIGGVARALMGARALGIVHRDLKPENVFLVREDGEEVAKVLDFGLAKLSDGESVYQTRAGALLGTPHYMSPEQVDGTVALDHRADLWSLAVIVFECLTGELPFDGETLWRLLSHITLGQPPVASRLVAELPPALDGWLARALARDPRSRFDSAQAFYHALEQALREGPPVRTLVAPIEDAPTERVDEDDTLHGHTSRPAVARPAGARGVAALVLAALVFGGAFLALQLRAPGLRHASGALAAPANSVGRALAAPAARVADIAPAAKSSASSLAGTPPAAPLPAPSAPRTAPSHLHPRRMD